MTVIAAEVHNPKATEHSFKNSFEKELNDTVRDRQSMRTKSQGSYLYFRKGFFEDLTVNFLMHKDNFMNKYSELSENNFGNTDLVQLLRHKEFPNKLITFVEGSDHQFAQSALSSCASKQMLRVSLYSKAMLSLIPLIFFFRILFPTTKQMIHISRDFTVIY